MARVPFHGLFASRSGCVWLTLSLTFRTHRHDNGSFRLANHIIMQDDAMRGLRHTTRHQLIGDFIRPAVRELHFFTGGKQALDAWFTLLRTFVQYAISRLWLTIADRIPRTATNLCYRIRRHTGRRHEATAM